MKDLEFYMSQNYRMVVYPLPDEDGGGWIAEIPELDGCASDGNTYEEALLNLREAKEAWLAVAIKRGQSIPLPTVTPEKDRFSGKFTLRVPKTLHRNLSREADEEGVSLNSYLLNIISERHKRTTTIHKMYGFWRSYNPSVEPRRGLGRISAPKALLWYPYRSEGLFNEE